MVPLLAASFGAPLAMADHPQPIENSPSSTIAFDHKGGNEWWVEVKVNVYHADAVYARAEDGSWKALTLRSWGNWAGSLHVPPGERVQFQAMQAGSRSDVYRETSCYFTHPQGVEQCDEGATDDFAATFRSPSGNEWWQQVYVHANRPVTSVHLRIYGVDDEIVPLTLRSWGAWAGSYHVPEGTVVRFYAGDGASAVASDCYRWPDATVVQCPSRPSTPLSAYQTRFDHKGGNEWWVETTVGPIQPTRVLAQDTGGAWKELTFRSWGVWAGSIHVEPGHEVRFRALVGETWRESCWFTHPAGMTPDGQQVCQSTEPSG